MAWNADYPLGSTVMSGSTEQIRTNWSIIAAWWDIEHDGIPSAASGTHHLGRVGVLYNGTTAGIAALSSPGTGALAFNTSLGEVQIYRYDSTNLTAGWEGITDQDFSRIQGTDTAGQGLPPSVQTQISLPTEGYDGLGEFSSSKYTAVAAGYYLVIIDVEWSDKGTAFNDYRNIALYKNGAPISLRYTLNTLSYHLDLIDVVSLAAGDYLQAYAYTNVVVSKDINWARMSISRLS